MLKVFKDKVVKQQGLQRSGTNYTKFLLENNYDVKMMTRLKHQHYTSAKWNRGVDVFVTIKHPLAWLVSIRRQQMLASSGVSRDDGGGVPMYPPMGKHDSFSDWFQCEGKRLCDHWSDLNNGWLNISLVGVISARYEDLLQSPEEETERIAGENGWARTSDKFVIPLRNMGMGVEIAYQGGRSFDPSSYIDQSYFDSFSDEDIELCKEHLDKDLMERFGYTFAR